MGLGQIYLNIKGREGHGIVDQAESTTVQNDLAARLLTMTDPKTGARMVDAVYKRDDIYSGGYLANAAELQVGLADGYRVSWQSTLGGSPPGIVYPNMKKWSGDHGSYDYKSTPGVLMSNRPLDASAVRSIMDVAPTVLKYFGVPIPSDIDGKPLF
jgi:predicted AlkP superfamily phosphohydrolase/phosphomutase